VSQFVQVVDHVIERETCQRLIERFNVDRENQRAGRVGDGLDPLKKRSVDIFLDRNSAWDDARAELEKSVFPHIVAYMERFRSLLVGALAPTVRDPRTGTPVSLDFDNFLQIGSSFAPALVKRLYRPGAMCLQRYTKGEGGYPHWHSEVYPQAGSTEALHRVLFWLCYLNDVETGGETEFAYQDIQVQPRAGRLLIAPASFTHTHRGAVPTSCDKFIVASWVLFVPR